MKLNWDNNVLEYNATAKSIRFWCTPVDANKEATSIFNDFLFDISKERNVFLHAYRLPSGDISKMIESSVILRETTALLEPFHTFFHLSTAKVKSNYFDRACESILYYCNSNVGWSAFLTTALIRKPKELMQEGVLPAYFISGDQGADFWFEGNIEYEHRVLQLFEDMSSLGWEIKQVKRLSFP